VEITQKYSEEELVALLKTNVNAAISYLYDHYSFALMGVIKRYVEDEQLGEDILQEVFLKIYSNLDKYDEKKGRLFTWMLNITRNLSIDTVRSKGYKKQQKILDAENIVGNIADVNSREDKFDTIGLRKRLEDLKQDQRTVIDLAYFNGFTQEEISKQLNLPLGTVKTKMRNAIISLRKIINP
jgi:RNA polymerase sigma factor (sigma-70 family)